MTEDPAGRGHVSFASRARGMAGVLEVAVDHPAPGAVTLRVVAGHGDRIRRAAAAIAPAGLDVRVLEDDLVATVPVLPIPDERSWSRTGIAGPAPGAAWTGPGVRGTAVAGRGPEDAGATEDLADGGVPLCCSYVFCRHRTASSAHGLGEGDRCRQKIRVTNGWLSCPGRYRTEPLTRRWWWRPGQ